MDTFLSSRTVGRLTIAAGILGFVGLVFLMLFYGLEASQVMAEGEPARPPLFGTLNDASYILIALLLIPALITLFRRTRTRAPVPATIAATCGLIGLISLAVTQALYVPRVISTAQQSPIISGVFGLLGVWMLLTLLSNRGPDGLSRRVVWLGIVTSLGMLALTITFFVGGGAEFASNPQAGMPSVPAIIGFAFGALSTSIGWPLWMIWLGIDFLREGA